ncbi:hypothetical protein MK489_14450 [Myxococcota bacterium]|nr:hypothetical protein [Myxococcota bacterium]
MPEAITEIPPELKPAAEAALAWVNEKRGAQFEVTGLVNADLALDAYPDQEMELGLVLCDGDICLREQVLVQITGEEFRITSAKLGEGGIPPELDPPSGVRKGWLDDQLQKHAFTVLVFYRGFW